MTLLAALLYSRSTFVLRYDSAVSVDRLQVGLLYSFIYSVVVLLFYVSGLVIVCVCC